MITFEQEKEAYCANVASIKVIGVGGAGSNTVNSIIDSGYQCIECIVVNTDVQALELSKAHHKIQIGVKSTKGLGAGANPDIGKRAAEEDLDKIMEAVGDADIVFLAAGMGGGTGSGALPVVVHALKEKNILSIIVVTKPFAFEGKRRARVADDAIELLKKDADTLIIIPNQKLLEVVDQNVSMIDAFAMINDVLGQAVRGISDIITKPGHINVDFADVCAVMRNKGLAVMGTGKASGPSRAYDATMRAISSSLLENVSIEGASGVLLNITGGKSLRLHEISEAASIIYAQAHEDANIILGSVIDEQYSEEVMVTIIATGFDHKKTVNAKQATATDVQVVASVLDRSIDTPAIADNAVALEAVQQETTEKAVQQELATPVDEHESLSVSKQSVSEQKEVEHEKVVKDTVEVSTQEKEEIVESVDCINIDIHDVDIPAFLRKEVKQNTQN